MSPAEDEVTIREFARGDEDAFYRLNEEWIVRYFAMEPKDRAALEDPHGEILDRGGRMFFAVFRGEIVGCCALLASGPGEFEVAKMAVTQSAQGKGIGRRLLRAVIDAARAAGAARLFLESNSRLAPAISLYETAGFRHIPPERRAASPYARCDVSMELVFGA
jgi:GNAT superfamily N-acetyltransferase